MLGGKWTFAAVQHVRICEQNTYIRFRVDSQTHQWMHYMSFIGATLGAARLIPTTCEITGPTCHRKCERYTQRPCCSRLGSTHPKGRLKRRFRWSNCVGGSPHARIRTPVREEFATNWTQTALPSRRLNMLPPYSEETLVAGKFGALLL